MTLSYRLAIIFSKDSFIRYDDYQIGATSRKKEEEEEKEEESIYTHRIKINGINFPLPFCAILVSHEGTMIIIMMLKEVCAYVCK